MEITQHPSTIGEMSPQHFQTFIVDIIKDTVREVTNARFDAIKAALARLELRMDRLDKRMDSLEKHMKLIKKDVEGIKDTQYMTQARFSLIEQDIIRHDRRLEKIEA